MPRFRLLCLLFTPITQVENRNFPSAIATLDVSGDRIYVGDLCESFFFVAHKREGEAEFLSVFADSQAPRHLTAAAHVDYDTMAGADKFGNVFLSRLPR
jgi:splicing factor 3B subunit 3